MSGRVTLACCLASAALVGYVMHGRAERQQAVHKSELAALRASVSESALRQLAQMHTTIQAATTEVGQLRKEQDAKHETLRAGLAGLRADTGGLRQHVANLHTRLADAPAGTAERYASACSRLLGAMGDRGEEMAAAGAAIARSAGGHFADDTLKTKAWPSVPSRVISAP